MDTRREQHTTTLLLTVGAIFGSSFLLVKLLVAEMPPAEITAWRLLFGSAAVMLVQAARAKLRAPTGTTVLKAAGLATLDSVIPNTLLAWAQIRMDSSIAALLIATMPMFTVVIAFAAGAGERMTGAKTLGLALGIAGVTLVVGADAHSAANGAPGAHVAVLLASLSNAAGVVYARRALASEDPLQLSGLKLAVGAAIAMLLASAFERGAAVPRMSAEGWGLLLLLGLLSNGLGRTLYLSLIASAGSVRASLVAYVVPAVGLLLGWLVLGERMGERGVVGLAMVVAGVALVTHGRQLLAALARARSVIAAGRWERSDRAHA